MTAVTDRTPALADLEADWWTETDMAAWADQIADDEAARPSAPSDVLAAEYGAERPVPRLVAAAWYLVRAGRVLGALWRFGKAHTPKWLLPVLAACLVIPGPFDELAVLALVLVPVLRSRAARHELTASVSAAWNGTSSNDERNGS